MELPPKPGDMPNLEYIRILTPYVMGKALTPGKRVLDVGSNLGYGSWLMASAGASDVTAVDLDDAKIRGLRALCGALGNVRAAVVDAQSLPFGDACFQVVTFFEVIEHIPSPDAVLSEVRRVLSADGILCLTTPNRSVRLLPFQKPRNKEHLREYSARGLTRLLVRHFPYYRLMGIYGEPDLHGYYRRIWRPSAWRKFVTNPLRTAVGGLIPSAMKSWINRTLVRGGLLGPVGQPPEVPEVGLPPPAPEAWPFYVSGAKRDCLNFFVVCGAAEGRVRAAAYRIMELRRRSVANTYAHVCGK